MNKPDDPTARLLAETLHDDWASGRPAEFARIAAAHARSRRRTRKLAATAGALAALALAILFSSGSAPLAGNRGASMPRVVAHVQPAVPARGYEIISDEELLAQVHDQPLLAVPGAGGKREIIVLANE